MFVSTLLIVLAAPAVGLPVDPMPDCSEASPEYCLTGDWELISWIPEESAESVRPEELDIGSGIAVTEAWRHQTGRWDVPVAVLDSGIEWGRGELRTKVMLNTAELPPPQRADGTEVSDYDLDGNGLVNVDDYAEDPRVLIDAGPDDGLTHLDASDLIHTFSDGVDDDGNGFTDDIAGWDFFNHDNDPYSVDGIAAYHGSGILRDAAGADGSGVCVNCGILPVRVGDGFITDADRIAMGIAYATDRGARAIGMALGALTLNTMLRDAVAYADSKGVVMTANPGDENSYHRNLPGVVDPIFYVHAVRGGNQQEPNDVYSYLNFPNCNNFGARVDFVASSEGCGSGATARTAGAAALLISAANDLGDDLSPVELRGLLQATADDIHLPPEDSEEAETYPSSEGWDAFYAHGRINVGRAEAAVRAGDIPPIARFTDPDWYTWTNGQVFAVSGVVDAPRSSGVSWELVGGLGVEPESWAELASGEGPADGVLAQVDPAQFGWDGEFTPLLDLDVVERYYRAHEPLLTLKLTVTDADGRVTEARRAVWAHEDPDLLPGFPVDLGSSAEPSPVLADFDKDDIYEIVAVSSGGLVYVVDGAGAIREGFPVATGALEVLETYGAAPAYASGAVDPETPDGVMATPAVGDIDGDDSPDIVVATMAGRVFAFSGSGRLLPGFPVSIQGREGAEFTAEMAWDNGIAAAPSLGDIDGDGDLEIVAGAMDQRLYAWDGDGALLDGYPMELCTRCGEVGARILSSPAIGDVDNDGDLDAAIGTNELPVGDTGVLWLIDLASATVHEGWPVTRDGLVNASILPVLGEGHPSSPAFADVDGDGDLEIASFAMLGTTGVIHHDGTEHVPIGFAADRYGESSNFEDGSFYSLVTTPSFGDLDQDGTPDLLIGGASIMWVASLAISEVMDHQQAFGAWSLTDGEFLPGFPQQVEDVSFLAAASVADVGGDSKPEALFGTGGYFLHAFGADGESPSGWPKFTGGWIMGGPAVGDIDGDGYLDVVQTTRDGYLFAWCSRGHADSAPEWGGIHHDGTNSANMETPLLAQAGPPEVGGGCCSKDGDSEGALLLLPLLGFALRRRRVSAG